MASFYANSIVVKLIPQHLHKAKLKTFTLYDISITKHTRVSRIFKKSYPPIYAPFSQSTPPRFNALVCAGFTIHKTVFFTLEKTLDSSNINIFSPIIGPYQPGSSTNLSNTVYEVLSNYKRIVIWRTNLQPHNSSTVPVDASICIQKPNGFSLSYPSMCHKRFGPSVLYCRRSNQCFDLASTPSGSRISNRFLPVSLSTHAVDPWESLSHLSVTNSASATMQFHLNASTNLLEITVIYPSPKTARFKNSLQLAYTQVKTVC